MEHMTVRANGADFHVARTGQGAPLLLLHGWPEFWLTCAALPGSLRHPFRADMIRRRVTMKTQISASGGVGLGRGGRMSRQRKRDTVLRMLRGEDLEILSRALGVTAATLTGWQDTFVAAGEASLATRSTNGEAL